MYLSSLADSFDDVLPSVWIQCNLMIIIIMFISYYNGTRFTKEIQLYIHTKRIYNSIIIILYKYTLTIETFMYLLEQEISRVSANT